MPTTSPAPSLSRLVYLNKDLDLCRCIFILYTVNLQNTSTYNSCRGQAPYSFVYVSIHTVCVYTYTHCLYTRSTALAARPAVCVCISPGGVSLHTHPSLQDTPRS